MSKKYNKLAFIYLKLTNNSIIKPRSIGGVGANFQTRQGYIFAAVILIIIFVVMSIIYLIQ